MSCSMSIEQKLCEEKKVQLQTNIESMLSELTGFSPWIDWIFASSTLKRYLKGLGLGFRAEILGVGLGFRVKGLGRIRCLEFRV